MDVEAGRPFMQPSPSLPKMEGLKRSRHYLGDVDDNNLTSPDKRQRTDSNLVQPGDSLTASFHTSNMSDITKRLQAAVQEGWSRKFSSYDGACVLLLLWEDDEAALGPDISSLNHVFSSKYHYATKTCLIPSLKSEDKVKASISDFLGRNSSPGTLLILCYAGHAKPNPKPGDPPLWTPRSPSAAVVHSGSIQKIIADSHRDVLLLYDCWGIAPAALPQPPGRRSVYEVLAAGSLEATSTEPASGAFTRAIADELTAACKLGSIKVTDLHDRLASRMKIAKPRGRGRPPKESQAKTLDEQPSPAHFWLSETKRSIVLTPLSTRDEGQVLLCIRVLNGQVDVSEWIKWIYHAPADVRDSIEMEGLYSGFSTMVILKVPVTIWDRLPECPSASLVGFTTTGDVPVDIQQRIDDSLARKLGTEDDAEELAEGSPLLANAADAAGGDSGGLDEVDEATEEPDGYSLRISPKKTRKALPTGRKLLPSERAALPMDKREFAPVDSFDDGRDLPSPTERKALPTARKPVKISIKSAGQLYPCPECPGIGFKDEDGLANHVRKQHTRPFHCVFGWAGCDSTFASKNEWKRHVMSQHILLYYWLCTQDACAKVVNTLSTNPGKLVETNGNGRPRGPSLPNGAIFNRKDLYTQHLRRMHTPATIKKQAKQAKTGNKVPASNTVQEWEDRVRHLQQVGLRERCQLPSYMKCPADGCDLEFSGSNAWDDRMEHVAKHLEKAAGGREAPVIFGGDVDPTLTLWATRPDVGIVKRVGTNGWQLDNPLRPEVIGTDPSTRERSKSVIEVAEHGNHGTVED